MPRNWLLLASFSRDAFPGGISYPIFPGRHFSLLHRRRGLGRVGPLNSLSLILAENWQSGFFLSILGYPLGPAASRSVPFFSRPSVTPLGVLKKIPAPQSFCFIFGTTRQFFLETQIAPQNPRPPRGGSGVPGLVGGDPRLIIS